MAAAAAPPPLARPTSLPLPRTITRSNPAERLSAPRKRGVTPPLRETAAAEHGGLLYRETLRRKLGRDSVPLQSVLRVSVVSPYLSPIAMFGRCLIQGKTLPQKVIHAPGLNWVFHRLCQYSIVTGLYFSKQISQINVNSIQLSDRMNNPT